MHHHLKCPYHLDLSDSFHCALADARSASDKRGRGQGRQIALLRQPPTLGRHPKPNPCGEYPLRAGELTGLRAACLISLPASAFFLVRCCAAVVLRSLRDVVVGACETPPVSDAGTPSPPTTTSTAVAAAVPVASPPPEAPSPLPHVLPATATAPPSPLPPTLPPPPAAPPPQPVPRPIVLPPCCVPPAARARVQSVRTALLAEARPDDLVVATVARVDCWPETPHRADLVDAPEAIAVGDRASGLWRPAGLPKASGGARQQHCPLAHGCLGSSASGGTDSLGTYLQTTRLLVPCRSAHLHGIFLPLLLPLPFLPNQDFPGFLVRFRDPPIAPRLTHWR